MPNGTYGGVRGRKMKVGGNDYIIFLLLDFYRLISFVLAGRAFYKPPTLKGRVIKFWVR